jgi:hypothetical protein
LETAEIERLEFKELGQQRRQMEEFQRENGQLKRAAEQVKQTTQQVSTAKRLKTTATNKQCVIDPTNHTSFGDGMLSSKMRGERGIGICEVLEGHCEGSETKLLAIIHSIIKCYGLRDQMTASLGINIDRTNSFIKCCCGSLAAALRRPSRSPCQIVTAWRKGFAPTHGDLPHRPHRPGCSRLARPGT